MIIVLSAYPDSKSAESAAQTLVEKRLAACVSIINVESSTYRWEGKVEKAPEKLLLIKSVKRAYPVIERYIKKTHPHKVPEIAYLEATGGQKDYISWLEASVSRALMVPLERNETSRAARPSKESTKAKKPRTSSN
ncbi:MAG: divalent-cation tolerance protein CutA [Candidatus Micrarchaeota archaeon]